MKLCDFLLTLRNDVPIEVFLIEPPEHPEAFESITVLYSSCKRCTYVEYINDITKLFEKDYDVVSIRLTDSDYEFRLRINVIV